MVGNGGGEVRMRWRYCCPKGHHTLRYRKTGHRYCEQCSTKYEPTEIVDKAGGVA